MHAYVLFFVITELILFANGDRIVFPREDSSENVNGGKFSCTACSSPAQCSFLSNNYRCSKRGDEICCDYTSARSRARIRSDGGARRRRVKHKKVDIVVYDESTFRKLTEEALLEVENKNVEELEILSRRSSPRADSSADVLQNFLGKNQKAIEMRNIGELSVLMSIKVRERYNIAIDSLAHFNLSHTPFAHFCSQKPTCLSTKYRNADGSCNNLGRPDEGNSLTPFARFLPAHYADSINAPRVAKSGRQLPSARLVSFTTAPDLNSPSDRVTVMAMVFGQFLDHDMTRTAPTRATDGSSFECCNGKSSQQSLRACFPIEIPPNDPFYAQFGQSCMSFVRSEPAPYGSCTLGQRQQLNQVTHSLDASMIYGSSDSEQKALRSFNEGKLKTQQINGEDMLPSDSNGVCRSKKACFSAGDSRVNENLGLAAMQTIFLRHHNKVAAKLKQVNPGWNDEILFQETRRIVTAQLQHITYNEFLPLMLGNAITNQYRLNPLPNGYSIFDPSVQLSIMSEVASAAFRCHSMIPKKFVFETLDGVKVDEVDLSETFLNPSLLMKSGYIDTLFYGMSRRSSQNQDNFFTNQVTNLLFKETSKKFGLDLVALNIQRGRDHGIPDYNTVRQLCGLKAFRSFNQLKQVMSAKVAFNFGRLYETVNDIDLFIAAFAENPVADSSFGPTLSCLIAKQFSILKTGDRFWYENGFLESSFTPDQLQEIRETTLAAIICENTKVEAIQPFVLKKISNENQIKSCRQYPQLSVQHWKNEPVWS